MKAKQSILICLFLFIAALAIFGIYGMRTATTTNALGKLLLVYVVTLIAGGALFLAIDLVIRRRNITGFLRPQNMLNLLLVLVFGLTILQPLIGLALGVEARLPNMENRELAKMPKLAMQTLTSFPQEFIAYVTDNFGFRKTLIHWNSIASIRYFNVAPVSSKVVLGKDDWLFYSDSINDYQGLSPLTEEQLQSMAKNLKEQRDWLAERGIYDLVVIVPNKETIYPEYLPDYFRRYNQETRLDQLMNFLELNSDVKILDLRDVLLQAKTQYPVYYHTDTHWNKYGAFVGYSEILKQLSNVFPDLQSPSTSDYDVTVRSYLGNGDLAGMLTMGGTFHEQGAEVVFKGNESAIQKKPEGALMFGDSFYNALEPYLSATFEKFVKAPWLQKFDTSLVEKEQPQVVISVMVERDIAYFLLP